MKRPAMCNLRIIVIRDPATKRAPVILFSLFITHKSLTDSVTRHNGRRVGGGGVKRNVAIDAIYWIVTCPKTMLCILFYEIDRTAV